MIMSTVHHFRLHLTTVALLLGCLMLLAGCSGQAAATPPAAAAAVESDSAAAVLEAYRSYGGEIANLTMANTLATADVVDLTGTIPAYDLTGGNPPCAGFVRTAPSLVFSLTDAVGAVQVDFTGNQPTSLIVVQEGEDIVCSEDEAPTMTPSLLIQNPTPGRYGVWIGRVNMDETVQGKLTATLAP
jgi:hypothetical protein